MYKEDDVYSDHNNVHRRGLARFINFVVYVGIIVSMLPLTLHPGTTPSSKKTEC